MRLPLGVEADDAVRGGVRVSVEVEGRAGTCDVLELARIAGLYGEREGVEPELAIPSGSMDRRPETGGESQRKGVRIP